MANVPTNTLNAGDSTPKLVRASLILATEAINELYSFLDPDTDNTKLAISRTVVITGDLSVTGNLLGNSSTATKLATARTIAMTGDLVWTSAAFDGSANVTAAGVLATVNGSPGSFGSAANTLTATINGKGLVTAMASTPIAISTAQVTSGTFADARIASTNVTQYQGSLSIAETQIPNGALLARVADNETISGTWTFSNTITANGNIIVTRTAPVIALNQTAAGGGMSLTYETNGLARWVLGTSATSEPGSNVGTDFFIQRRADDGTSIDLPLQINRATGLVSLSGLTVSSTITGSISGAAASLSPALVSDMNTARLIGIQSINTTAGGLNTPSGFDVAGAAIEVRRSNNTSNSSVGTYQLYATNDTVNALWFRKVITNSGAPNEVWGPWSKILTDQDTSSQYVLKSGDIMTGNLSVTSAASSSLISATATATNTASLELAGNGNTVGTGGFLLRQSSDGRAFVMNRTAADMILGTGTVTQITITSSAAIVTTPVAGSGSATAYTVNKAGTSYTPKVQQQHTTQGGATHALMMFSGDALGSTHVFAKSRNATVGLQSLLSASDNLGGLSWVGSDGTVFQEAARIDALVDGTAGANSMPGALTFSVTPTGTVTPVEAGRFSSKGALGVGTTTPGATSISLSLGTTSTCTFESYRASQNVHSLIADGANAVYNNITVSANAGGTAVWRGARARGTAASPTAVNSADSLTGLQSAAYDGSAIAVLTSIQSFVDTYTAAGNLSGFITINTRPDGAGATLTERARFDKNGNFGLGTTSPTALLDVRGTVSVISTATGGQNVTISKTNSGTANQNGGALTFANLHATNTARNSGVIAGEIDWYFSQPTSGAAQQGAYITANADGNQAGTATPTYVAIGTTTTTTCVERLRVDSTGSLLINSTTNPTNAMINIAYSRATKQGITITPDADTGGGTAIIFTNAAGTTVGGVSTSSSATTYATSSDYRLKIITGPLTTSGAFIDALQPKVGSWKADGTAFVGFLAHEFQEVSPTSVTGEKDGVNFQTMDAATPEVMANVVAELQSLRIRTATLEEENTLLKQQMAAVMQKLGM